MANVLNTDKQIAAISALTEGSSIRSIERITGVHRGFHVCPQAIGRDLYPIPHPARHVAHKGFREAAVALHFAYYNFVKRHNTLRCTPAMAAGIERDFWSIGDLIEAAA